MTVYLRTRRAVTITITNGATASVADGSTLQLAVSTTGSPAPTVAYSSSDELVATVSASGLVTGVAEGAATITATATNSAGSAQDTIDVTVTAAGADDAEPTFDAPNEIVSEDWESYTSVSQIESGNDLWNLSLGSAANMSLLENGGPSGADAVRLSYGTAEQSGPGMFMQLGGTYTRFRFTYSFRVTSGFSWPGGSDGVKWIEWWRPTAQRWTNGVGSLSNADGPTGFEQTGNEFSVHDNTWDDYPPQPDWNPFCQNVSKTPKFTDVNDGQWHTATYECWLATGRGARIWIDGTLILSTHDGAPGVPAGGLQMSAQGINEMAFGEVMPSGAPQSWNLDIGPIRVWSFTA